MPFLTSPNPPRHHCLCVLRTVRFPNNYVRTTKYTLLTFLPLNLYEQFHKVANVYFLVVFILQLIPGIPSTVHPIVSFFPLAFVLTVTAIKEAVEDHRRYQADLLTNNKAAFVVKRSGGKPDFVKVKWSDIQVGDVVKVEKNQIIPADLVVISWLFRSLCQFLRPDP